MAFCEIEFIYSAPSEKRCIIVAAHFDGLGILDGKMYRGADSNASGVVAMLSLAEMMQEMRSVDVRYDCSILFVALDVELVFTQQPSEAEVKILLVLSLGGFLQVLGAEGTALVQCIPNRSCDFTCFFKHVFLP